MKYLVLLEHFGTQPEGLLREMEAWLPTYGELKKTQLHLGPEIEDEWERFLLLYSVFNLTAHVNHEACKAHADANGNETLVVHGRWKACSPGITAALNNATAGELALLNSGVGVRMRASRTIVHATLDEQVHVPDGTRNNDNVSVSEHKKYDS